MKFKTKKEALEAITERTHKVRGTEYPIFEVYLGTNLVTGKHERLASSSRARLREMIDEFYDARTVAGDFATSLSPEQIVDARGAMRLLADARLEISLTECARREVERSRRDVAFETTAGEAYDSFMETKELNSHSEFRKTECTTGKWIVKFGRSTKLVEADTKSVTEYLKTNYDAMSPKTFNQHLTYIRTFLNWCVAQHYIPENPASAIRLKPIAWKEPEFMSTLTCAYVIGLLWARREERPDMLALCVNGLMMGIRREETLRMASDPTAISVNLEDETVRVGKPKGYTKGIMPRAFHMPEMAAAFAKAFDYHGGIARVTENTSLDITNLAAEHNIRIPHNGFRHTFITKHVAAYGEPDKTQAIVGTSAQMRANNYCGLDSKKEGEEFFSIRPPSDDVTSGSPSAE